MIGRNLYGSIDSGNLHGKTYNIACKAWFTELIRMTTLILAKYDMDNLIISISKLKQHGMRFSSCPIDNLKGYTNATWNEPLVCTIEYMPSEKVGIHQPTFKEVRDVSPRECRVKERQSE